jgi:hypothetical protein
VSGTKFRAGSPTLHLAQAARTTPEASDLHKLFRRMVDAGCSHAVLEVSSHSLALKRVQGCAFAVAVFFDAFVVRMTIMPAVLVLLRERAWWLPSWLDRVLPDMDVEGSSLGHRVAERERVLAEEPATA